MAYIIFCNIGLYPQVGWKIGGDLTFLCEGYISGIGTSVDWGLNAGIVFRKIYIL